MNLEGKRAFVTGGAGGIGGAISRTLRDAGAVVTATVLNEDEAARAALAPQVHARRLRDAARHHARFEIEG